MLKFFISAFIVHLLLFGSIFIIYFRSPIITDLNAQKPINDYKLEAPAKRLVLFVTDGLRAESFFHNNCSDIPYLKKLIKNDALVGISHTRVPTESRPGHIALIAGFYEDPSAVTRGWKENPINFDTIFNRSDLTYAWGANDVLNIFSKLNDRKRFYADIYDHDLDFSGSEKTYELDKWVFERVDKFLKRKAIALIDKSNVIFFLHLLGLDTAGHIHKPGTNLFLENLHYTESEIYKIYEKFQNYFPDNRTAYILTSDHGMTNAGSHGAGDSLETETPFILWGAGLPKNDAINTTKTFQMDTITLPLHKLEQAQFAPLMTTLLGLAPPINNFGILNDNYINASIDYRAYAVYVNALQLLQQFQKLHQQHSMGGLASILKSYNKLNNDIINNFKIYTNNSFNNQQYNDVIDISYKIMHDAIEGIAYYHGYYRNALLLSVAATFLLWLCYLLQLLNNDDAYLWYDFYLPKSLKIIGIIIIIFIVSQRLPISIAFYLLLPILISKFFIKKSINNLFHFHYNRNTIKQFLFLIIAIELLVISFFYRQVIAIAYILLAFNTIQTFTIKDVKLFIWLSLVIVLIFIPTLPASLGYENKLLLLTSMIITITRPMFVKQHINRWHRIAQIICYINFLLCIWQHSNQIRISYISMIISWSFLIYTFIVIYLYPSMHLKQRLEFMFFNLTTLYTLFCTSYEALLITILLSELIINLSAKQYMTQEYLRNGLTNKQLKYSFLLAFIILLYTFFSFFGTGNIASVSSFDPNIIRCFLTTFSPFIIMFLVILKLCIPILMIVSSIFAISYFARFNEQKIFICLLFICDVMGMNFLFFVRNEGSWLEIGTSISHFVIMEATTLVLLLITILAKVFLRIKIFVN